MKTFDPEQIKDYVRERYGAFAKQDDAGEGGGCGCSTGGSGCCSGGPSPSYSEQLGYSAADTAAVPAGADLGLGCGNPLAIAGIQPGETELDLGSGAGFDALLAARQLAGTGRVIGVDMTPPMIGKARRNAAKAGFANVEFRLGEIEHLPVADATVDLIISNCVINLSPDKPAVYGDAFRVLKPGGRLAISDVVRLKEFPECMTHDSDLLCACVAGAASVEELEAVLAGAGFRDIRVTVNPASREFIRDWAPGTGIEDYIAAASVQAVRPLEGCDACAACDGL